MGCISKTMLGWCLDLQSPFVLEGGILDVHFDNCGQNFRETVEKERDML